jgi:DNA polymerase-3 subunit epsilon
MLPSRATLLDGPSCDFCRPLVSCLGAHQEAIAWARELMERRDWAVLDTEITGLGPDDEVIEIAVLDAHGRVVLDTLVRPLRSIPPAAQAVHGLSDADVAQAPSLSVVWPRLQAALAGRWLVIYNAACDTHLLAQSARLARLDMEAQHELVAVCAMRQYAAFRGERRADGSFRWWSLKDACQQLGVVLPPGSRLHRAAQDCCMTLALVRAMASAHAPLGSGPSAASSPPVQTTLFERTPAPLGPAPPDTVFPARLPARGRPP